MPVKENPYDSPDSPKGIAKVAEPGSSPVEFPKIAREVFWAWGKLRVTYLVCLVSLTLLMDFPEIFSDGQLFYLVVEGAVVANLAFFAGPLLEISHPWCGYRGAFLRWIIFLSGTVLAVFLAAFALLMEVFPQPLSLETSVAD